MFASRAKNGGYLVRQSPFLGGGDFLLVLVKFDRIQNALEFLARVEAREHTPDLVGAYIFRFFGAFAGRPQPEAAEVAQFDDVALRQFGGDNGEEALDGCHHIDSGQRGHLCRPLCQFTRGHAPARLDGGIELLGSLAVNGICSFDDIKLYTHGITKFPFSFIFSQKDGTDPSEDLHAGSHSVLPMVRFRNKQSVPGRIFDQARQNCLTLLFVNFGNLAVMVPTMWNGRSMALRPRLLTGLLLSVVDKKEYIPLVTDSTGKFILIRAEIYHLSGEPPRSLPER